MMAIGASLSRRVLQENGTQESISIDQAPDPLVLPTYRDCDADPTEALP